MKEDRGRSVGGGRTWGSERREGNGRGVGCEEMPTENMMRAVERRMMEEERKKERRKIGEDL